MVAYPTFAIYVGSTISVFSCCLHRILAWSHYNLPRSGEICLDVELIISRHYKYQIYGFPNIRWL